MTKILIEPLSIKQINTLNNKNIAGYIVGIKNYSIFQPLKLDINELKQINVGDKELYISINKPLYNDELDDIKTILKEISEMNISGIIFEDIAVYNINKNMNLNLNLIWGSMHLPTNSSTCNFWSKKGCKGALLSTELMLNDFKNIKKNTNMDIIVYLYGHLPIFESSRELITNYLKYINKEKNDNKYYLYEEERNKYYTIYEEYNNTFILDDVLNGINYLKEINDANIDYVILNGLFIDENEFNNVIDEYITSLNGNYIKKDNVYTGFLLKESVFKVMK